MVVDVWQATLLLDALITLGVTVRFVGAPMLAGVALQFALPYFGFVSATSVSHYGLLSLCASVICTAYTRNGWAGLGSRLSYVPLWVAGLFLIPAAVNAPVLVLFWVAANLREFWGPKTSLLVTRVCVGVTLSILLVTQKPVNAIELQWLFLGHCATWAMLIHFSTTPTPVVGAQ